MENKKFKKRYKELEKLFDSQIRTLSDWDLPLSFVGRLRNKEVGVLDKAIKMEIPEGHIPFLPVVPEEYISDFGMINLVCNGKNRGVLSVDSDKITNNVEVPEVPYFIFDVDDGREMLGKSPKRAKKLIIEQGRSCLTASEGITVCIHTNVLSEHCVDCTGSNYEDPSKVLDISLFAGTPRLCCSSIDNSSKKYGSASCRFRS